MISRINNVVSTQVDMNLFSTNFSVDGTKTLTKISLHVKSKCYSSSKTQHGMFTKIILNLILHFFSVSVAVSLLPFSFTIWSMPLLAESCFSVVWLASIISSTDEDFSSLFTSIG